VRFAVHVQTGVVMRRHIRFSIAGLMGVVVVAAISLAALRTASELWAGMVLCLTCGVLALAVVGVFCGAPAERAWWLGFSLFGWGYLTLAFWSWNHGGSPRLPTLIWLEALTTKVGLTPKEMGAVSGMGGIGGGMRSIALFVARGPALTFGGFGGNRSIGGGTGESYAQIGHCLWALLFATVGGMLASVLFPIPASRSEDRGAESDAAGRPRWNRYVRPAALVGAGLALGALLFTVRSRSAPGLWAGATFLATCGILGLTALAAFLDRTRRGDIWLGAAVFGAGYMILAFGRDPVPNPMPHLPTDQFLSALRPWLPRSAEGFFVSSKGVAVANDRILKALDRPVAMHFPEETPFEDVVKHVTVATKGPDGSALPIYVDPIGMQEAEKSMTSVVRLDLEGVPLKTTLDLCLKQLGLGYIVRDGVLVITSLESTSPVYEDPFLIGGHCVLAILAAALGGALAPLVSAARSERG
jgi:hypothetical protein